MKKYIFILTIIASLTSCNSKTQNNLKPNKKDWRNTIQQLDDSIHQQFQKAKESGIYHIDTSLYYKFIARNIAFYKNFPEDKYAEEALQKVAAIYLQMSKEDSAVQWRDTILNHFPNVKNKIGLLELQMNYYDFNNYTPKKIKYYAEKLLAIDGLSEERRQKYEFRLQHIDLTFQELIEYRMRHQDSLETNKQETINN